MLQLHIVPEITDAVDFNLELMPCELSTIDNGIKVYSIKAGAQHHALFQQKLMVTL